MFTSDLYEDHNMILKLLDLLPDNPDSGAGTERMAISRVGDGMAALLGEARLPCSRQFIGHGRIDVKAPARAAMAAPSSRSRTGCSSHAESHFLASQPTAARPNRRLPAPRSPPTLVQLAVSIPTDPSSPHAACVGQACGGQACERMPITDTREAST